ncbi:unnamed protein product [Caenorhabditis brenneri]
MAEYVKQFFKAKRRKTNSNSEDTDSQQQRPTSSNSSGPSGASTSSSSAAFLSPSSTTNSMDYILGTMSTTMSPSTSTSTSVFGLRGGQAPTGLAVAGAGHRRQHSSLSAGHLQQYQQELQSRNAATIARIAKRRAHIEEPFDPNERPPKFKQRSPYYKSETQLEHKELRMILIEAESRVLYDTLTVIPIKDGIHPAARGKSACGEFQFLKHRKDTKKLSQMIFGAVPNMRGNESFRIHMLEDEEMILVSRTFSIPKQKKGLPESLKARVADPMSSDSDSQSTVKSLDGWRTRTSNSVMSTPEAFSRVRHVSITFGDEGGETDSHNQYGGGSPGSSFSLPRGFSPPHRLSKARRRQMAVTTSLSETSAFPIPSSLKSRSRMSSMSSTQADEEFQPHNMRNVALAILVPMPQKYFLMQHIPLVESEMSRLETRIINASGHSATFFQNISKSWDEVTEVICQLHNAPRLKHPYWLALNEACQLDGKTLAVEFCEHLTYLVRRYDRKEAGYFLSNLITALLMHHLSWIASVATPPRVTDTTNPQANMLFGMGQAEGAPTVGYNALMAQYLEIAGACGNTRSAKICILGDDIEILASVIAVLSFFIRCSAVKHVEDERMWEVPAEQPFSPIDVSGSPTTLPGCSHHHQNPNNLQAAQPSGTETFAHSVTLHHPHPEETSSVAMMRRLRNNNQAASDDNQPTSSAAAALRDAQAAAAEAEGALVPRPEGTVMIDPADFPCCPTFFVDKDMWAPRPNPEGLGRSMFAGPVNNYCQHFVLSGVIKPNANMPDVYSRMFDEVRCIDSPCHRSYTSTALHHQSVVSSSSQSTSSMSEPLNPENVLIVADLENLTVKVLSSEGSDEVTSPSESVVGMLEQFVGIHDAIPTTAEFLVGMIEDSLAHVVGKSLTLVELVRSEQTNSSAQLTPERVRSIIGCDHSDLRLIVNVAAVYWPPVLQSVLG